MRRALLQLYRLAALVAIAWIVRAHAVRMRIEGNFPITLAEVRAIYPKAAELRPDSGERAGMFVWDGQGHELGYVLRTSPITDDVIGYRGWTDTLIAFDPALHVLGVRLRSSQDTQEHAEDVSRDRYFLKTWNGKSWDQIVRKTPEEAGIEGVSGATMTSMAMAEGIMRRLRAADAALAIRSPPIRFTWVDGGLVAIIAIAVVLAFVGTHGRPWLRRGFQVLVIAYVGFVAGAPLAQSLFAGWAQYGAPWRNAPALVLLAAAALVIPWTTRKPLYCHHLCPHGAAQELLGRIAPRRWRLALPKSLAAGLRWLPPLLLAVVLIITILGLPMDLAHLEPFDAYSLRAAGVATLSIAIVGLIASLFVPMAYCRYGCPTGALLEFIRAHGPTDHFGRRDVAALLLVAFAGLLSWKYQALHTAILAGIGK
ncbi:MAG TPA: FMN-binding protein [Chthoniobacter sp.]|jgi:hypothetical protein